ncbi:hypothetical protein [Cryobacterium psychrophilum]|uniref:Uncharacterized protein n=1 Tax=Cryobacterium psychrophilum TaxID=41988 RepID=A0A4Y8KVF2_9MICO|nr:hypothetical protein [Cryobacterium psychrophilum]TDW29387.1 hypothetical protein EDD25_1081 [Cryobacterium psychrophilum]TFD81466.1 hypothetical protein E3T53_03125 [Cryobacterium psychrophilum]
MTGIATYRAVLYGPNPIAGGLELDLEYVDGEYQDSVVLEAVDDGNVIMRSYRRGHETEEPVPYRFHEETDVEADPEPDVPN